MKLLINVGQISCRSYLLKEVFTSISKVTANLPDFIQFQLCKGVCEIGRLNQEEGLNQILIVV